MEITRELVEKLTSDDITKKKYDEIIAAIGNKADEIWRFICETSNRKLDWWAFSNDLSMGHGNGSTGGEFDPTDDAEFITIEGRNKNWNNKYYEYNEGFPTRFLWEDYRAEVKAHVKVCIELDKAKKTTKDDNKDEMIKKIKSKLTVAELKLVRFV